MDISTLFAAPTTAASPAALSFGVLGGTAAPGEGGEGLDSFNQLLGNFLNLTGGAMPEGGLVAEGMTTAVTTDGVLGSTLSQGVAGLLQGLNLANPAGGVGTAGKAVEGRWAQSGLNLLAGSALAGQELNQEVVAFLNDLSTAISTGDTPLEGALSLDTAIESVGEEGEVATLDLAMQGEASTLPVPNAITVPVAVAPTIIPREVAQAAPSPLGLTLTVAGTGLKALPTVPVPENATAPVTASVIPKLTATPVAPAASRAMPAPPADPALATPVAEMDAGPMVTAEAAEPVLAAPADAATISTAAKAAPMVAPVAPTTKPAADQHVGAIALPAELAATAAADDTPVPQQVLDAAKQAEPAEPAEATASPAARPDPTAPRQTVPARQAAETAPAPVMGQAVSNARADDGVPATPAPAAASDTVTITATRTQAKPVAVPAAKADAVTATPVELSAEPASEASADSAGVIATEPDAPTTPSNVTTPAAGTVTRPAAASAPVRPAATPAGHAQTAVGQPTPEVEADAAEIPVEDEEATNSRMLAPKHVGAQAQAEMQDDIAGQAQSAGQNQTSARDMSAPTVNGEREDNLLARAVTAAGKGSEGNAAGEGEAGSNPDTGTPADSVEGLTGATPAGEPAKAQGTDFAQSLRQSAAPHRPGAYIPPTHQMAMQVQRAIADGNDRLSIRLNPQELGRIDVQLEIGAEGKLRAKVMVENPQTLEMLQKDAKSLEKALQDAGLQTDQSSLSFSLQDSGDQARERQERRDQSGHGTGIALDDVEQEDPAIIAQAQIMELGRVDVRV